MEHNEDSFDPLLWFLFLLSMKLEKLSEIALSQAIIMWLWLFDCDCAAGSLAYFFCCLLHKSAAQNTFKLMCLWNNGWWVLAVHVIQTYSHNSSKTIAEYLFIWLKLKTGILSLLQKFEH